MSVFLIEYNDPETGEPQKHVGDYFASPGSRDRGEPPMTAKEWAEDHAYALADKGWFRVKQLS